MQNSKVGEIKLLKPDGNVESVIFKNIDENETDKIFLKGNLAITKISVSLT